MYRLLAPNIMCWLGEEGAPQHHTTARNKCHEPKTFFFSLDNCLAAFSSAVPPVIPHRLFSSAPARCEPPGWGKLSLAKVAYLAQPASSTWTLATWQSLSLVSATWRVPMIVSLHIGAHVKSRTQDTRKCRIFFFCLPRCPHSPSLKTCPQIA